MQINLLARAPTIFPLAIHASGRYFVDKNGTPFLVKGDSGWMAPNQLTRPQVDAYFGARRARGFNSILIEAPGAKFSSQTPATNNAAGDAPFTDFNDWTTTVEAYWAFVDYIVNAAFNLNMAVFFAPAYLGFNGGDEGFMTNITANSDAHLQAYGQFIARRYTQGNIVWVMGGDFAGDTTQRDKQWQIVTGMRSVRTGDIITGHPSRTHDAFEYWGTGYTGFNANIIYTDGTEYTYAATAYGRSGPLPFFLLEAYYENEHSVDSATLVRQSIVPILSGGCGAFFGNNPIWSFGDPVDGGGIGAAAALVAGLSTSAYANQANVWQLFDAYNWQLLQPRTDTSLITTSLGSGTSRIVGAMASDGSFAMIYTPGVDFTVNMTNFTPGTVRGRWYQPAGGLGAFTLATGSPYTNTGTHAFIAPGTRVLVLDGGGRTS